MDSIIFGSFLTIVRYKFYQQTPKHSHCFKLYPRSSIIHENYILIITTNVNTLIKPSFIEKIETIFIDNFYTNSTKRYRQKQTPHKETCHHINNRLTIVYLIIILTIKLPTRIRIASTLFYLPLSGKQGLYDCPQHSTHTLFFTNKLQIQFRLLVFLFFVPQQTLHHFIPFKSSLTATLHSRSSGAVTPS